MATDWHQRGREVYARRPAEKGSGPVVDVDVDVAMPIIVAALARELRALTEPQLWVALDAAMKGYREAHAEAERPR